MQWLLLSFLGSERTRWEWEERDRVGIWGRVWRSSKIANLRMRGSDQEQRECGAAVKAQLRLETMNMQWHQPARLWFFLAAPSSLQVQRRQEHRSKAGCNRRKNRAKLMTLARKLLKWWTMVCLCWIRKRRQERVKKGEKEKDWNQSLIIRIKTTQSRTNCGSWKDRRLWWKNRMCELKVSETEQILVTVRPRARLYGRLANVAWAEGLRNWGKENKF